jgi:hypothetical protein
MTGQLIRQVRGLSEAEFRAEAEPALRRVFQADDPFDQPFAPDVERRLILFPVYYELESPLLEALVTPSLEQSDSGFYLSVLERPAEKDQDRPYHWYVSASGLDAYRALGYPFVLENAVYSPEGKWGIMVSHENHALLGGTASFVDNVRNLVPNLDNQVFDFLAAWEHNKLEFGSSTDWLPTLVKHVYGEEAGETVLAHFNRDRFPVEPRKLKKT